MLLACTTFYKSLSHRWNPIILVCSPVAGDVSCFDATGLRKRNPRRHSAVAAQVTSVDDELYCSARVLIIVVRPHHSTPPPTALVKGKAAN